MGKKMTKRMFGVALTGLLLVGFVAGRTLTRAGTVYSVPRGADLVDSKGNVIQLRDLRGVGSPRPADFVEFWSRRSGRNGTPEVTRLRVKPAMKF